MTRETAEIVAPCADLGRALEFFESHGFRLEMIMPADAPHVAVVSRGGVRLRLEESGERSNLTVLVHGAERGEFVSPDGVVIRFESDGPAIPPLVNELVVTPADGAFHEGRAGMLYRDLLPTRLGGAVIASHISIPKGGPIADYVHFHKIKFQLIYCLTGRARLVYEDQGAPFWFEAGDCVLQPPEIRHQVLECSDAFSVLEVGAPAVHETFRDHEMVLGETFAPGKDYRGQKFVHHKASEADWNDGVRETGVSKASNGAVDVRVMRRSERFEERGDGRFLFYYVAAGEISVKTNDGPTIRLEAGGSVNLPAGRSEIECRESELIRVEAEI